MISYNKPLLFVGLIFHKASYLWSPYGVGNVWHTLQKARQWCIKNAIHEVKND